MGIFATMLKTKYASGLGSDAVTDLLTDGELRVIDMTAGAETSPGGQFNLPTIEPACRVRRAELDEKGLTLDDMIGSGIVVNGVDWVVSNVQLVPNPEGEAAGEVLLVLRKDYS